VAQRYGAVSAQCPPRRRASGAHQITIGALPSQDRQGRGRQIDPAGTQVALERSTGDAGPSGMSNVVAVSASSESRITSAVARDWAASRKASTPDTKLGSTTAS
jgi:hypothetical protein